MHLHCCCCFLGALFPPHLWAFLCTLCWWSNTTFWIQSSWEILVASEVTTTISVLIAGRTQYQYQFSTCIFMGRTILTRHEVAGADFAFCHPSTIFIRYSFTYNCRYDMTTITDKYPRYEILGINQSPIFKALPPTADYQSNWRIYRVSQKKVAFRISLNFLKAARIWSCPLSLSVGKFCNPCIFCHSS